MVVIVAGALMVGLTLGLFGSGGSAITVPVLVYLVGHHAKQSIAESMAIVGLISVMAAIRYARSKQIDWRSVWYFGIPGMLGTFIGAWLGGLASEVMQLLVFGVVLIAAAYAMFRKPTADENDDAEFGLHRSPIWKIGIEGTVVGIVTGFVGVGGGFLIVSALVVFGRLPMRLAIGTSLVIIVLKAAIGFAKYQQYLVANEMSVDGQIILIFVLTGVVGSMIGKSLNSQLNQRMLKQSFAVFLVLLGGFVIVSEGRKFVSPSAAISSLNHAASSRSKELPKTAAGSRSHANQPIESESSRR
ncbi:MAG: sulfite exporter TauE/SafE family protein [Rubripirellula sp.]